jgi:uncharacterized secreted protein with C-terminal beta-propeller domain
VAEGVNSFKDLPQLQSFLLANAKSAQRYGGRGIFFGGLPANVEFGPALETSVISAASEVSPSYTGTNVQVQGVDEPDIVKTDGTHLFVATDDKVTIINAYPPNSAKILSAINFSGSSVLGIETSQDRLLVISQQGSTDSLIELLLYDVSNLSSPRLVGNSSIEGSYVAARMAQGYVYAIVQQASYQFGENGTAKPALPQVYENGNLVALPPSSVYYAGNDTQISYYTMIVSVNLSNGANSVTSVLTGPSSTIYVSTENIYVVYTNYLQYYADGIPGDVFTGGVVTAADAGYGGQNSTIFRASYSNGTVEVQAVGYVPGTVLNQFSLDEYDGYFRVATSHITAVDGNATTSDDVYVLDQEMGQVSALKNIAPGENIYAVRFVGDLGYVVTFEQIDPLFVISFQDMARPVILSALKVNGYSDYLYPLPNGYLIGVGKDSVPSSSGNFAYYLGLKLSLFQVFDNGTSIQVSRYLIGDRGTDSPVLSDHLAFTFDSTRDIMVIPVLLAEVSGNQTYDPNSPPPFGDYVWQGVYVFNVTESGFTLLGRVSQYPAGQNYGDSPTSALQIDRSVIIGDTLYTISQSEVMVSGLYSLSTLATIPLG